MKKSLRRYPHGNQNHLHQWQSIKKIFLSAKRDFYPGTLSRRTGSLTSKKTPLVYMVSPMASTCNHYAAGCTKTEPKILQVKRGQKQRNAPDSARKRRNRVRFGCWRGVQPVRTGGETRNPNQNAPDSNATHEKRKPAKPQCFRRFFVFSFQK